MHSKVLLCGGEECEFGGAKLTALLGDLLRFELGVRSMGGCAVCFSLMNIRLDQVGTSGCCATPIVLKSGVEVEDVVPSLVTYTRTPPEV